MMLSKFPFLNTKAILSNIFLILFFGLSTNLFSQPTESSPTPPDRNSVDVVSIFSDAYSNVSGTNFNPFWDQNTVMTTEEIGGNDVIKYASFNYQGIELTNAQNVSEMEFVHVDLWTSDASTVNLFLISPGPKETPFSLPITANSWQSYDIPLSEFSDIVDLTNVFQFKFDDGAAGDAPTLFIDNLYFYKSTTDSSSDASLVNLTVSGQTIPEFSSNQAEYTYKLPAGTVSVPVTTATPNNSKASVSITPAESLPGTTTILVTSENENVSKMYSVTFELVNVPLSAAPTPPTREESAVISIFSDTYTKVGSTNFNPSWGQSTKQSMEEIDGNAVLLYEELDYQGIEFPAQNVENMSYVHIDVWTSNASAVSLFLISSGPQETPHALEITPNVWKSYDIPLNEFSEVVDLSSVFQFKITDGSAGDSPTIYIDNVYFFSGEIGASTDATLANLKVNETTIPGFSSSVFSYQVELGSDIATVPTVTAIATNENADVKIIPATEIPGSTVVEVTAENQTSTLSYTIDFIQTSSESDALLSDLTVNDATIDGLSSLVFDYTFDIEDGVTEVPTVTATTSNDAATVEIIQASGVPGTTIIKVTSEDETNTNVYTVFYKTSDLIWWDEFTNPNLNLDFWSYDIGDGCAEEVCGWGNKELQIYQQKNVYIDEIPSEQGNYAMVIEAEQTNDSQFISGRINSQNKVDIQYGILEVRMKVPDLETGLWPAVWLLGSNNPEVGWPQSGEIDIMEMGQMQSFRTQQGHSNSTENQYVGSNIIWYTTAACNEQNPTCAAAIAGDAGYNKPYVSSTDMIDRFQTYRLYWNKDEIKFTVEDEGTEYNLYEGPFGLGNAELQSVFRKPFYMILNMAVGGTFTDALETDEVTAPLPAKMYVDYIRLKDYNGAGEVFVNDVITDSETDQSLHVPKGFELLQNYPNPFNPNTEIAFELQGSADVRLVVFDILGREISTLVNEKRSAGLHTTSFNASGLSSGIYFYSLQIDGSIIDTKKMILLK